MSIHPADSAGPARDERDQTTRDLLDRATLVSEPTARQDLLDQAVLLNLPMARALAQQYQRRGVDSEDLRQVAMLGLVKSVRGFRPRREKTFAAYAVPTISGEIKRHFRDRGWMIRPPRGLQELNHAVRSLEPDLVQRLQRTATPHDVAQHLGVDTEAIHQAREAGSGYDAYSLDSPHGDGDRLLSDVVADSDDPYGRVDDRLTLRPAVENLEARERRLLHLRFVDELTQEQIGARMGVSQMQVSRLLTAVLGKLRQSLLARQEAA